jgi:alpha-L-fucosidase
LKGLTGTIDGRPGRGAWGVALALGILLWTGIAQADGPPEPTRTAQWRQLKFGLMLHWGLYSVAGGVWNGKNIEGYNEQILHRAKIPWKDYEALASEFNPVKFDADYIAGLAREAGMRHIIITSKHHDGFNMFHTRLSDFNIVDRTPYGQDPIKQLADACGRQRLGFGVYYSLIDWHYPGAAPMSDHNSDPITPALEEYTVGQLRELLTGYGPLCEVWFDMSKPTVQQSYKFASLVRTLQPNCLVSGRIFNGQDDFLVCGDNEVPTHWFAGAWETPVSIFHDTWGYRSWQVRDNVAAKIREKIRDVAAVTSKGGNYLLNIGPRGDGSIVEYEAEVLRGIGRWIRAHEEAIWGAEPVPDLNLSFGYATTRPGRLYLYVEGAPENGILKVPHWQAPRPQAKVLSDAAGTALECTQDGDDLSIHLPAEKLDPNLTIVAVDYTGPTPYLPTGLVRLSGSQVSTLATTNALGWYRIVGNDYYSQKKYVTAREWQVMADQTGEWQLSLTRNPGGPPAALLVEAGDASRQFILPANTETQHFDCGRFTMPKEKPTRIVLKPAAPHQELDEKIQGLEIKYSAAR